MMGRHRKPKSMWRGWTAKVGWADETSVWPGDAPAELRQQQTTIVAHPGKVVSRSDGDEHHITFVQLCRLYGVDPRTTLNAAHPAHASLARYRRELAPDAVIDLFPREDGGYNGAALVLGLPGARERVKREREGNWL